MSTLSRAPLVEAVFELRWGAKQTGDTLAAGPVSVNFDDNDVRIFPGSFLIAAKNKGFTEREQINFPFQKILPQSLFMVTDRFRRKTEDKLCYQIGTGIFTVNQLNEDYDWKPFKKAILEGIDILDTGHPKGIANLPLWGIEIRYVDGFIFEDKETLLSFFKEKFEISFNPPTSLFALPQLEKSISSAQLSFSIKTHDPKGILFFDLKPGTINGQNGFITNTTVRSINEDCPKLDTVSVSKWLDQAHVIQKAMFDSLLNKSFQEKLK